MILFNKAALRDKIYACWLGKNIGGTIGTPYEGKREVLDVKGFVTEPGKPLPNDDLDLQLVWLRAISEVGPENINSKVLGEYWLDFIVPFWNEYGVGKSNLRAGIQAPMSGEYNNHDWKHSNGAWIRTEVWACMAPGLPENAIRFAYEDACVDHGMGEGTYATIFVAAVEAAAFVCDDIRKLFEIGLSKIPETCRTSQAIRMVIDAYDSGKDWLTARNLVTEDSLKDLGWFQAPANVAYVVLGLLYGKCDFKESMLTAVNCGDDTDCTAATVGSILGIMYGTKCVPKDWQEYIGDSIITLALNQGSGPFASSCTQLTDMIMEMVPVVVRRTNVAITDGADNFEEVDFESYKGADFANMLASRSPYSISIDFIHTKAVLEYDRAPEIEPNGQIGIKVTFYNLTVGQKHLQLRWLLPEGWKAEGKLNAATHVYTAKTTNAESVSFTITAGENVTAHNRLVLEAVCEGRATVGLIPVLLLG